MVRTTGPPSKPLGFSYGYCQHLWGLTPTNNATRKPLQFQISTIITFVYESILPPIANHPGSTSPRTPPPPLPHYQPHSKIEYPQNTIVRCRCGCWAVDIPGHHPSSSTPLATVLVPPSEQPPPKSQAGDRSVLGFVPIPLGSVLSPDAPPKRTSVKLRLMVAKNVLPANRPDTAGDLFYKPHDQQANI